jgi:hypothetical protein
MGDAMNLRSILASSLLLAAFALAAAPAHADRDAVQFGGNIEVPEGSSVHDAVCFFCSVNVHGIADHDIVVFFGNVHIAAHANANHDVVNFFGNVRADNDASIAHDLVSFFGSVRLGENVSVGNDMVVMIGSIHTSDSVSIHGNRVYQPGWVIFIPLIFLGGLITLIVSLVRSHRRQQMFAAGYQYPPPPPPPPQPQPK